MLLIWQAISPTIHLVHYYDEFQLFKYKTFHPIKKNAILENFRIFLQKLL
jgi:hypothetical protein